MHAARNPIWVESWPMAFGARPSADTVMTFTEHIWQIFSSFFETNVTELPQCTGQGYRTGRWPLFNPFLAHCCMQIKQTIQQYVPKARLFSRIISTPYSTDHHTSRLPKLYVYDPATLWMHAICSSHLSSIESNTVGQSWDYLLGKYHRSD